MSAEARPLYLLGQQRLARAGACIQQSLPELAARWWGEDNRVQLVAVSMWDEALRSSSVRCVVRDEADGWLALLGTQQAWLKLAESWLGCDVPADSPLVETLHREFCLALHARLSSCDGAAVALDEPGWFAIPGNALTPGGGALVVELDVDGIPLTLLAPIAFWPEIAAWPPVRTSQSMQQVASALGDTPLRVDVRLPGVRVAMTDMASLAVGDFLNLEHDLSGRVRVTSEHVDIDLPALLGQHGGCKAIRIEDHGGSKQ